MQFYCSSWKIRKGSHISKMISARHSSVALMKKNASFAWQTLLETPKRFQGGSGMKGHVASKTPTKIHLEAGKVYKWCACGLSSKQPFCDGSHQRSPHGILPIELKATETKDSVFCNCKQTNKGPFCDGTHKKI